MLSETIKPTIKPIYDEAMKQAIVMSEISLITRCLLTLLVAVFLIVLIAYLINKINKN